MSTAPATSPISPEPTGSPGSPAGEDDAAGAPSCPPALVRHAPMTKPTTIEVSMSGT